MNPTYKQNLRRTLLQLFYEISDGDQLHFISRHELAEKLGFNNAADSRFMSNLKYLTDLYFIKVRDNIHDTITTEGIQEAEAGYPTLQGVNIFEDSTAFVQFHLENVLVEIHKQIERDAKGILEGRELYDFESEVIKKIQNALSKSDKDEQLLFDKIKPHVRNEPKSGLLPEGSGKTKLEKYITFIENKLQEMTGEPHKTEAYIPSGKVYDGRRYLRSILNLAQSEIFIIDNYLSPEILDILGYIVEDKNNIKIRFLIDQDKAGKVGKVKSFLSDLKLFKAQYLSHIIECREQPQKVHDRFIIIDSTEIYHSGNSFDNIGSKSSHINKIEDEDAIDKQLTEAEGLWNGGNALI